MHQNERIYLDYAATTPIDPEVLRVIEETYLKYSGNPSSLYRTGREAAAALLGARVEIAKGLNADSPDEILFTGSGSESDNLAIIGAALARRTQGNHLITSSIEHHAVLHACKYLEKNGFEVTYLPVDEFGLVDPGDLKTAIRPTTILISVMYANNEIGTVQPISDLAAIARDYGILFHSDAVQSIGQVPIDVKHIKVDCLTFSAHKFYGPRGVGILYKKGGIELIPLIHGGNQEYGNRAGTENLPGILAAAKALRLAITAQPREAERLTALREQLFTQLKADIPTLKLNGHPNLRLPNNLSVCFKDLDAEALLLHLNKAGIEASMGSACTSTRIEPSHVIRSIGVGSEWERGVLRLSLGKFTTSADIKKVATSIKEIIQVL